MNDHERHNDWIVVAAIALIAVGVWFLLGTVFGPFWQEAVRRAVRFAWPIALIAFGVLLLVTSSRQSRPSASGRRLYRSRSDRMISGVLAGVGNYLGIDPTVVRVLYVVFSILTSIWPALVFYVIATVVIPEEPAGGSVGSPPNWPSTGGPTVKPSPSPSTGWPHTGGRETVQTPPPPPAEPGEEAPPAASGPAQS